MTNSQTKITTDIIIHTNTFASSFGEEMCAYMTGEVPSHIYEEYAGLNEAEEFQQDPNVPQKMKEVFSGNMEEIEGEYGPRYVEFITTPGWFNNGLGEIYEDTPENEAIALAEYKKLQTEYIYGHYTGAKLKSEFSELDKMEKVDKYASEQGIWMTFEMGLNQEQLDFLKKRAYEYAQKNNITIISFEANETTKNVQTTVRNLMV